MVVGELGRVVRLSADAERALVVRETKRAFDHHEQRFVALAVEQHGAFHDVGRVVDDLHRAAFRPGPS